MTGVQTCALPISVLIPTAAANACGIAASNSGHCAATDGDGAISALLANTTTAANARTQIAACGVYHPAVNLDIVSRTAVANVTLTAADARAARLSSMRRCRDIAAVDGDTTAVSAVFTISSATTANTCASATSFAAVGGDRAAVNLDGAAVAAISRTGGTAANTCAAIIRITKIIIRNAAGGVDYAAMNGNAAAVNGGGAAADARAGITAIVSHAGGVQRAAIFGLGVDGQAVGARRHNALFRCEGAAVRQEDRKSVV